MRPFNPVISPEFWFTHSGLQSIGQVRALNPPLRPPTRSGLLQMPFRDLTLASTHNQTGSQRGIPRVLDRSLPTPPRPEGPMWRVTWVPKDWCDESHAEARWLASGFCLICTSGRGGGWCWIVNEGGTAMDGRSEVF